MKKRIERRVQRHAVRLAVMELNGQPAADVHVVDLSSLGARLEAGAGLAPRNAVEFTVLFPGQPAPTRLSGQVVWLRPLTERPGRFQMGVKFFSPQWELDRLSRACRLEP